MAGQGQFAAFISYSSHDAAFARRLHKALERYRVPQGVGTFNLAGKPNRVAPVFLDRAELSSGELGAAIASAIENSTALVVICSPHAAASEWVDKEIRHFVQTGRVRRIFAIIASGEPFASSHGASGHECFPAALREMAAGQFGEPYEVVAGDARPGKDGFRNAWLKVAAGILDVGFGKLLDRDAAARRGRALLLGATASVVAAVVGTLTTFWFLESQRYQSETRASLLREVRSSFELDDSARAVAALASLVPTMPLEDRARYQPVLDAWSARFPHMAAAIANAPAAFSYRDRVFLKTAAGILATPLPADVIVAADADGKAALAIDFNGRVWHWRAGESEAKDLQLPIDVLGGHDWSSAVRLKSGSVVFGGTKPASYAGGEDPAVLVVNETSRSFALIQLGYTSLEDLRLASDCSAIAYKAGSIDFAFDSEGEESVVEEIETVDGFKQLDLRSASGEESEIPADVFDGIPLIGLDRDDGYDRGRQVVNALASACGGGAIMEGAPPPLTATLAIAMRELDVPDGAPEGPLWDWTLQEAGSTDPAGAGPEIARIATLADAIQRARVEIGKITRIRDGEIDTQRPQEETFTDEEPDPQADAELVSYEFGARLGVYLALDAAAEPTLSFYAAEGKYVGSNVCGFAAGKAKCISMGQNGLGVEFAAFPDFIYAGGTNYLGYPLFTLIDRRTFDAIEFRSDELDIAAPALAGSVALSPTGRQMAIAFARTVLLFDLDEKLVPRLARKLSVAGLAEGADGGGLRGVCTALTYIDETTLVASRGDGLNLKLDLQSGEELWRFRLPASAGCNAGRPYVATQVIPSPDGKRLAVRGSGFIAMLDTATGLPLLPAAKIAAVTRWEDDGYYSEERAKEIAGDYDIDPQRASSDSGALTVFGERRDCIETGSGCSSEAELIRSARNLSKLSEPLLAMAPSGETLVRTSTFEITLASPPAGSAGIPISSSPQCFTGWRVAGSRIEPFDLMKNVRLGAPPVPQAELLAQCE
ncbi:MAG TPA: toll/interleukin-1 receptor domain-containing protein [Hyphomonadaceae bacterium]|nr:toll/interleukin-1 receptor domain-containing protein [Hyphomonadaceae bacterium]